MRRRNLGIALNAQFTVAEVIGKENDDVGLLAIA